MSRYIAAIDQGTTSTRCILFGRDGRMISAQREHRQIYPKPGWVEHDPVEILLNTESLMSEAMLRAGAKSGDIAACGITNQRETTVVWRKRDGQPIYNAVVWQDTRTQAICDALAREGGADRFRQKTGLPLATYFSATKLKWILDNVADARRLVSKGELLFGTIDSWLIWNLTGSHVIDVTNASRTLLMNLHTLDWDDELLKAFDIPRSVLPKIVSSSSPDGFGHTLKDGPFEAPVSICGDLGDQQAALVGQGCFTPGECKNTYGTGCFMLLNTGPAPVQSKSGLLTTVAYRFGNDPAVYALEGSVAIAGALVQWLRDNLGIIATSKDVESLAAAVPDNGDVYFIPAFSGLFAPRWRGDARGTIVGMTRYTNKSHLARAALEATAYQTRDVLEAMRKDAAVELKRLKVDGGMTANDLLMQFQSDILGVEVIRPPMLETTALGAAYAAGKAVGFWRDPGELTSSAESRLWKPAMSAADRDRLYQRWLAAVERSLGWV
jgi:glycerol kinase